MLGTVEISFIFGIVIWLHIARHSFLHTHHYFPYYLLMTLMS